MKTRHIALVCALMGLAVAHAQPPRKPTVVKKHITLPGTVDVHAAARATAALYVSAPAARSALVEHMATQHSTAQVSAVNVAQPAAHSEVWTGAYVCEHAEKLQLRPDAVPDHLDLQWKGQHWSLRQVDSKSGAMRFEDADARVVWIQLANKSMLLDQRQGRRLLDECQHDVQVQTAAQMKHNPPPALFDTAGMGR